MAATLPAITAKKLFRPCRGHDEGLIGQKGHDRRADGAGDAGGQKHAVPEGGAHGEAGQQIGVQGDDVRHGHEGGQTGQDFRLDGGAVLLQVEMRSIVIDSPFANSLLLSCGVVLRRIQRPLS